MAADRRRTISLRRLARTDDDQPRYLHPHGYVIRLEPVLLDRHEEHEDLFGLWLACAGQRLQQIHPTGAPDGLR